MIETPANLRDIGEAAKQRLVESAVLHLRTGYYGVPGRTGGPVHVADSKGRPLCGVRMHPDSEFQWCANGIRDDYVECKRCRRAIGALRRRYMDGHDEDHGR